MIPISQITGRLGNQMFEFAALYAHSRDLGVDFYRQDPVWFEKYADDIRAMFSVDIPGIRDEIAIHVRRGDYVNNSFYTDLTLTDYYEKARQRFPACLFRVFSDDIAFCKEHFKGDDVIFSEGKTEIEDLNLMASCKGHILANSSFSWWGAWLCPLYPNNPVIAPAKWFSDGVERTKLPAHWIKL